MKLNEKNTNKEVYDGCQGLKAADGELINFDENSELTREMLEHLSEVNYPQNLHSSIMKAVSEAELEEEVKGTWTLTSLLQKFLAPNLPLRLAFALSCVLLLVFLFEVQPTERLYDVSSTPELARKIDVGAKGQANFLHAEETEEIYATMAATDPTQGLDEVTEEEIQAFLAALDNFNKKKNSDVTEINRLELHLVTDK
jgi:hypothetical protein